MPEAKNTFLKAKMNQDLDDRLLPNGEYRTAQNVLVGKSEEDSVGTLENIKGNEVLVGFDDEASFTQIIGRYVDKTNNRIFLFVTNNTESVPASEATPPPFSPIFCAIYVYYQNGGVSKIVDGNFLNFSTQSPILSVNLLEDLLFWTDNRNQPRKINVTHSLGYYTEEHQISVAKYNPYEPISLVKQEIEEVLGTPTTTVFDIAENANVTPGMIVVSKSGAESVITAGDFITVGSVDTSNGITTVTLSSAADSITAGDIMYFLSSTMTDESGDAQWPGDPSYLESRFVRFSYRFKFDDNEYSIFAPFTQIAFIPKQKGYFVNGQEQLAVNSTILEWFENGINNVELIIPLPHTTSLISSKYKIKEIDILYKESDQIAVKVLDTISVSDIPQSTNTYYAYSYQSRKPIRTLPEAQTVRVYDKVPVKAKTQEVVSNRVVYGNFRTKHTPPDTINYTVNIEEKRTNGGFNSFAEYPNHTVKQNRTYQVGFVLSDKYGRQSDVILSPVSKSSEDKGSTIFAPYIPEESNNPGVPDPNYMPNGVKDWFGNSLILSVQSPIIGNEDTKIYAEEKSNGFNIDSSSPPIINGNTYSFTLSGTDTTGVPAEGYYMRGQYTDYVKITQVTVTQPAYQVTTSGQVNDIYLQNPEITGDDTKYVYKINPLGWYSYKIVVKQTEQEYYNVYLPSAINANNFPTVKTTDTATSVSYITLINDNINKVPRDLAEVGPDQKQYRSSVRLFGRVQPTFASGPIFGNQQYFPLRTADTSTAVGNTEDILGNATAAPNAEDAVFQYDSNPIVARISTNKEFGIDATDFSGNNRFSLAVYETEPVVSALDIYWETSQAGLISDLNTDILTGFGGPVGLEGWVDIFNENIPAYDEQAGYDASAVSEYFAPLKSDGTNLTSFSINIHSVTNGNGDSITGKFALQQNPVDSDQYRVILLENEVFLENSNSIDVYTITFRITDDFLDSAWVSADVSEVLQLSNATPSFDAQATSPNQEYYYFYEDSTTAFVIRNFLTENNPLNGSADPNGNTSQLKFDLSGPNANLFSLDEDTGILRPSVDGVAAGLNTYDITVTLTDANRGPGSIPVSQDYRIVKGYEPSNNGNRVGENNWQAEFNFDTSSEFPVTDTVYFAWYMSDNTLAATDLPEYKYDFDDSYATFNYGEYSQKKDPLKVANAVTQGGFIFGIEKSYIFNLALGQPNVADVEGNIKIHSYYREVGANSWNQATDLNNTNSLYIDYKYDTFLTEANNKDRGYAFFAQERNQYAPTAPGLEFAFIARAYGFDNFGEPGNEGDYGNPSAIRGNVLIRDLHYTGENQTQQTYVYKIYPDGGSLTPGGAAKTGNPTFIYADNPLAENVEKFFNGNQAFYQTDFSDIYKPTSTQHYFIELEYGPATTGSPGGPGRTYDRNGKINDFYAGAVDRFSTVLKIDNATGLIDRSLVPVAKTNDGYTPTLGSSGFGSRGTITTDQTNTYFDYDPVP